MSSFWHRLQRFVRHRWIDERAAQRLLPAAALDRLQARVAAGEQRHGGEIRVVVEAGLPPSYLWRQLTARQRAITLFGKLRVWDTERNNGVLIYLLLAEHRIELVADRGVARLVPQAQWDAIVAGLGEALRARRYEEGLSAAVEQVDALLLQHFAVTPGELNPNELPDRPAVL
jgi:uncharacterized membrane protein